MTTQESKKEIVEASTMRGGYVCHPREDKFDDTAMMIRELLEKELWGDEDATLKGQVNSGELDLTDMTELRAQLATVAKRMQALLETIENPKMRFGEEQATFDFDFGMDEEPDDV